MWASAGLTADPITDAFARQLDRTAALPKVPEWERIATEMQTVAELFVRGKMSLDAAVDRHGPPRRPLARKAPLDARAWMSVSHSAPRRAPGGR